MWQIAVLFCAYCGRPTDLRVSECVPAWRRRIFAHFIAPFEEPISCKISLAFNYGRKVERKRQTDRQTDTQTDAEALQSSGEAKHHCLSRLARISGESPTGRIFFLLLPLFFIPHGD